MKPTLCSHEQSIIAAVQTESWTDVLRMHLGSCASCQETLQIAGYMHSLAARGRRFSPVARCQSDLAQSSTCPATSKCSRSFEASGNISARGLGSLNSGALLWIAGKVDPAGESHRMVEHWMGISRFPGRFGRLAFGGRHLDVWAWSAPLRFWASTMDFTGTSLETARPAGQEVQ